MNTVFLENMLEAVNTFNGINDLLNVNRLCIT